MWVGERGRILGSVTIGGCVDAYVLAAAEKALSDNGTRLLSVELGDEDAQAMGLSCAGSVDVLVQPVNMRDGPWLLAMEQVRSIVESGARAVTATLLPATSDVDPPGAGKDPVPGATLVLQADGTASGSTGDADLDGALIERGKERFRVGGAATENVTWEDRVARVFFETHGRGPLLAIVGAGPVAAHLSAFGRALGHHVVVIDGRARFVDAQEFPDAHEVVAGAPAALLGEMAIDASSAIVLVAHDYKFDLPVLRALLPGPAGYIGMLGSRKRVRSMLEMLADEGMQPEQLQRLHAPIGLDIGGRGAAEIALSIAGEITAVRHGRPGGSMKG